MWMRTGPGVAALVLALAGCGDDSRSEDGDDGSTGTTSGTSAETTDSGGASGDADATGDGDGGSDATGSGDSSSDTGGDPPPLDECSDPDPAWIFCDGFEAGGTWDGDTTNPVLVEEPGPFGHAGNHAAQLRVPAGRGGEGLIKDLPEQDAAYLRFFIMWEPGHDFTAARHGPGGLHGGSRDCLGCSGSRPSDWFMSTLETVTTPPHTMQAYTYYPGMYMDCADPNGSCWGDMFPCTAGPSYCTNPDHAPMGVQPELVTGQWYCVEQMIDAGTPTSDQSGADGVLDFWIDEQEIGPWGELWLRSSPDTRVSTLWLYLFHHDEHSAEGLLLDNVIVSTSRVGCL